MPDLVEWLNGQLDADEAIAQAADRQISEHGWHDGGGMCTEEWDHIEAFGPAHVLRTIAAHRAILARHSPQEGDPNGCDRCSDVCGDYVASWPCPDVLTLAAIYRDRPGFDQSWIGESA